MNSAETDCVFCSIVDGAIPSHTVYEDDSVLAFLDANPLAPGHTLVIPKSHHERLQDLPEEAASRVYTVAHRLTEAAEASVDADATTVAVNDGAAAGQEVPHVHCHVVPRFDDDGGGPVHAAFGERPDLSEADLDDIAADISARTTGRIGR
jgi:histidine triad (HIT) family protein